MKGLILRLNGKMKGFILRLNGKMKGLKRESEMVDTETEWENERVGTETEWENERVYTETEWENERVDTETEGESERVDTETEGENERVHDESIKISFHVGKGSLSQPSEGSIKWDKRSEVVNAKWRLQYKLNPISKRLNNQRYYQSQPEIRSQKVLHAYHANPSHNARCLPCKSFTYKKRLGKGRGKPIALILHL